MILVTGGTGLVGAHLLFKLISENEIVRATYRTKAKLADVKTVFSYYTKNYDALFKQIEWVEANILDVPALETAFQDVEYVYHCAALVSFSPNKYKQLRCANITGTANIVNFCIASKTVKKLCHVSSIATIGKPLKQVDATEKTTWNTEDENGVYAITKYGAEMEVWRGTQEGLDAVIVNPGVILGSGSWQYSSSYLFMRIYQGLNFFTSGTVGLVDVEDVVNIMVKLLKSDIINERFILVAENWSYKSFLQFTAKALNVKPPKKLAKPWLLSIGWRLDWLAHTITRRDRRLTKNLAKTLQNKTHYSNSKLVTLLDYNFNTIETSIRRISKTFLKDRG